MILLLLFLLYFPVHGPKILGTGTFCAIHMVHITLCDPGIHFYIIYVNFSRSLDCKAYFTDGNTRKCQFYDLRGSCRYSLALFSAPDCNPAVSISFQPKPYMCLFPISTCRPFFNILGNFPKRRNNSYFISIPLFYITSTVSSAVFTISSIFSSR